MKSEPLVLVLFVVLLFLADEASVLLRPSAGSWSATAFLNERVALAYGLPCVAAGAFLAMQTTRLSTALALGVAFGLSFVGAHAAFDGLQPVIVTAHGSLWDEFLGWSNLFMPLSGALLGALAGYGFGRVVRRGAHAT